MQRGKARKLKSKDTYTPLLHGNAIRSALSTASLSRPQVVDGRVTSSPRAFSAKADQTHETAAATPVLVPCAWVRAPCIEGTAPSAALCEAPTSSARSAARLGVITAGQLPAFAENDRLRGQCWPASLAVGGSSAHLAGARSTRSWLSSQANRSGGVPEQSRHAAPAGSCFLDERGHRGACLRQIALNADMTALALQHRPQRSGRSGGI